MLPAEKRKTNIGVGTGILLQILSTRVLEGPLGLLVLLVGLALFAWGCMSYMRGKGHHPAWGILGVFSLIGLVILFFFPDRHKEA
jgi:hypothetical protein